MRQTKKRTTHVAGMSFTKSDCQGTSRPLFFMLNYTVMLFIFDVIMLSASYQQQDTSACYVL